MFQRGFLRRAPIRRKPRRGGNPQAIRQWVLDGGFDFCFCCGASLRRPGVILHNHHLLNGKWGRKDDPRNVIRLCDQFWGPRCHQLAENDRVRRSDGSLWPTLSLANCLWLKREHDPAHYDPDWLQSVMARVSRRLLPDPEPLSGVFLEERIRKRGLR